jgi:hypothetical protein
MAVQTKRKTSVKKETVAVKYERLQLRHWVMFWVLVAATHALVITIFSNVDVRTLLPVNVVNDEQRLADQVLIDDLKAQVKSLGEQVASVEKPSSQGRTVVNVKDVAWNDSYFSGQDLPTDCGQLGLNDSTATQTYLWRDESTGIQAELPYSFNWGNDRYLPTPYEQVNSSTIAFGPFVIVYQGCSVGRQAELTFRPSVDPNPVLREVRNNPDLVGPVRQRVINGITVLSYRIEALGYGDIWDVFGRSYHYTIKGGLTDAEAMNIIQSLRVTQ